MTKSLLFIVTLLCSMCAQAFVTADLPPPIPVSVKTASQTGDVVTLTFQGLPGVAFCVAYAAAKGASISDRMFGTRPHNNDFTACLSTDRNGLATHSVRPGRAGLLLVNLVSVDDRATVTPIPLPIPAK